MQKKITKLVNISPTIAVILLNVNGLKTPRNSRDCQNEFLKIQLYAATRATV